MTTRTTTARVRALPWPDKLMLVVMLGTLLIGLGRLVVVAVTVPYATLEAKAARSAAKAAPGAAPETAKTLAEYLQDDKGFERWWGGRLVPARQGHDYLQVLSQRSYRRTLGSVLGTVIEQQNAEGVRISKVIVPKNNDALVGGEAATFFTTAEGDTISGRWASVRTAARRITDVRIKEVAYNPVLTDEQVDFLNETMGFTKETTYFRLGAAPSQSGTWVMYSHITGPDESQDRTFLLIPAEVDPKGVAR
ncbi:MAG TPA: hypothetical protein VLA05_07790 [Coriobacteriia bacterium]|nr:hypothetical protein [Coriobacteriia bacterium]